MTALEAVAVHLPPRLESIKDVGARIGLIPRQLGLFACHQGECQSTLIEALEAALDQAGLDLSGIMLLLPYNVNQASW